MNGVIMAVAFIGLTVLGYILIQTFKTIYQNITESAEKYGLTASISDSFISLDSLKIAILVTCMGYLTNFAITKNYANDVPHQYKRKTECVYNPENDSKYCKSYVTIKR
jgi:hypothetical protein